MFSRFWTLLIVCLVGLDQASKYWATRHLFGVGFVGLGSFFRLHWVFNKGAAYGIFAGQLFLLSMVSLAALFFLIYYQEFFKSSLMKKTAVVFLFSGAFGNGIDRLVQGGVVDFIDIRIIPVFNLADVWIHISVWLFLMDIFYEEYKRYKCR